MIKKQTNVVRSGDFMARTGTSAREIDQIISELGRLYVLRIQALRLGTALEIQTITSKIAILKTRLNQL